MRAFTSLRSETGLRNQLGKFVPIDSPIPRIDSAGKPRLASRPTQNQLLHDNDCLVYMCGFPVAETSAGGVNSDIIRLPLPHACRSLPHHVRRQNGALPPTRRVIAVGTVNVDSRQDAANSVIWINRVGAQRRSVRCGPHAAPSRFRILRRRAVGPHKIDAAVCGPESASAASALLY